MFLIIMSAKKKYCAWSIWSHSPKTVINFMLMIPSIFTSRDMQIELKPLDWSASIGLTNMQRDYQIPFTPRNHQSLQLKNKSIKSWKEEICSILKEEESQWQWLTTCLIKFYISSCPRKSPTLIWKSSINLDINTLSIISISIL